MVVFADVEARQPDVVQQFVAELHQVLMITTNAVCFAEALHLSLHPGTKDPEAIFRANTSELVAMYKMVRHLRVSFQCRPVARRLLAERCRSGGKCAFRQRSKTVKNLRK